MIINENQLRTWLDQAENTYSVYHQHRKKYLDHIKNAKTFHDMEITDPKQWHDMELTINNDRINFIGAQHVMYQLKHCYSAYHKFIIEAFKHYQIYSRASAQEHLHNRCQRALDQRDYRTVNICSQALQMLVHNQNRYVCLQHFSTENPHGYAGPQDVVHLIRYVLDKIRKSKF